jgi:hypothetical protein
MPLRNRFNVNKLIIMQQSIQNPKKATNQDIEMAATKDLSEDFLTEKEKGYYFKLKDVKCVLIANVNQPKANCQ